MKISISATEAVRNFSDLINRVHYKAEEFVIERGGQAVCCLVSAKPFCTGADLKKLLATTPRPDKAFWDDVEEVVKKQPKLPRSAWPS